MSFQEIEETLKNDNLKLLIEIRKERINQENSF